MTSFDHLFVIMFGIVYPVAGSIGFHRLIKRVTAGQAVNRSQLYASTILSHWTLFLVGLLIWRNAARPWSSMGLTLEVDLRLFLGTALTIAGIMVLVLQLRRVQKADHDALQRVKTQLGKLLVIIPRNGSELGRFFALSLTAGIVEEMLWRGFLIWYLGQFMPISVAALASTLGFGLAHAYQGVAKLPQIMLVGAAFAGLYLLTGSIWLPVILHVAVDMLQGYLAYEVLRRSRTDSKPEHNRDVAGTGLSEPGA